MEILVEWKRGRTALGRLRATKWDFYYWSIQGLACKDTDWSQKVTPSFHVLVMSSSKVDYEGFLMQHLTATPHTTHW